MRAHAAAAGEQPAQVAKALVGRRSPGGVHEQRLAPALAERPIELLDRPGDAERRADDAGVGAQLLDGAGAEAVGADEAEDATAAGALLGGDLGDGRRLADTGRADKTSTGA